MWGFLQSTFVRVPLNETRSLKSNAADMLWWARTELVANKAASKTNVPVFRLMTCSFPSLMTLSYGFPSRKFRGC